MDAQIIQGFVEQSEAALPKIRGGILICAREGNYFGELNSAIREVNSIKDAAALLGLDEIKNSAANLDGKLKISADRKEKLTDEQAHQILDELVRLETLVARVNFSLDDFSLDITDFVDEYFDNIQIAVTPREIADEIILEPEADEIIVEPEEEFEIDEEMMEVFALEAEELIESINANLKILEKSPNNREALLEVRRNAHTLKGSGGIVGLKKLSQVAHRVEDLLDYLAENEVAVDERIFALLSTATNCLEVLANGENSAQITTKIAQIFEKCDELLASLKKKTIQNFGASLVEGELKTEDVAVVSAETAENKNQVSTVNNRAVVRVSLEKLDDLVRCVSGLVVNRSAFEQRLSEFERQIEELQHSTMRLQASANKLEVDAEAGMPEVQSPKSKAQNSAEVQSSRFKVQSSFTEIGNSQSAIRNPQSFDALEFDRYTEFHQITRELVETTADNFAINSDLMLLKRNFEQIFDSQRLLIDEMQDKLFHLRMVSFGMLAVRMQRTVRVTCDEEDKQAELLIEGENLEIDTQILDSLVEPLLHLLRNAVAHGIEAPEMRRLLGKPETGKISVRVFSDGTHLVLTVSDDGRGISAAALKEKAVNNKLISLQTADTMTEDEAFSLVFLPGLTTAEQLSQISGRGVGMNIVKTNVERRQGTVTIESEAQKGTTFTIRLPLPLAVTRALPVKSGEQIFAFPLKLIKKVAEISTRNLRETVKINDTIYTVAYLNNLLGISALPAPDNSDTPVLLIETAKNNYALIVDEILKPEEIVIKRLGFPLDNSAHLLGAAILGNGNIIPVLDLLFLLEQKSQNLKSRTQSQSEIQLIEDQPKVQTPKSKTLTVLIVDDSPSVRHLTSKVIKNAEMTAIVAKDGLEALENLQNSTELPNVILTDVEMPRMDGYELLASLKKQEILREIPVIMITSRAGEKHRQRAFDLGVSDYLSKPFADAVLIEKVKNLAKV